MSKLGSVVTTIDVMSPIHPSSEPPKTRFLSSSPPPTSSSTARRSSPDQPYPAQDAPHDSTGIIDMDTFRQILDLDEDDTHDFSKGMALAYYSQAAQTFEEMDSALEARDLAKLSSLGHFLKGSSAALGVAKVQASCERMQHLGQQRDEEAGVDLDADEAIKRIGPLLIKVKKEYSAAEQWLKDWYAGKEEMN